MSEEPAREYGTRQLRTRITSREDGRFLWSRERLVAGPVPDAAPAAPEVGPYVLLGTRSGHTVDYLAPADQSLAHTVWPPGQGPVAPEPATAAMRAAGRALRDLAASRSAFPGVSGAPPALSRLVHWLREGGDGEGSARLHALCASRLGASRLDVLREWCRELTEPHRRPVLLHGEPSLGLIVPVPDGAGAGPGAVLLTGETLSLGPWEFDPGWLIGELAEMADIGRRHVPAERRTELPPFDAMAAALLEARDDAPDLALLGRVATLRRLAHVVDFATYVGWNPGVGAYVEALADLVDGEGRPALVSTGLATERP
ncbi:hypothetical protein [Streptomyces sp. NPDC059850]|uniref:hypothetical protein n=1 Tax=Streptomyces sp. NPDC059850 TaxID=3346970 RepID=UPI00365FD659